MIYGTDVDCSPAGRRVAARDAGYHARNGRMTTKGGWPVEILWAVLVILIVLAVAGVVVQRRRRAGGVVVTRGRRRRP
jgi:hypothetical protein